MDLKTVLLVFALAFAMSVVANAAPEDYTIDFPTTDADHSESVLIICNKKTRVCTKEIYKNKDLEKKAYDQTKALKALKRVEDVSHDE